MTSNIRPLISFLFAHLVFGFASLIVMVLLSSYGALTLYSFASIVISSIWRNADEPIEGLAADACMLVLGIVGVLLLFASQEAQRTEAVENTRHRFSKSLVDVTGTTSSLLGRSLQIRRQDLEILLDRPIYLDAVRSFYSYMLSDDFQVKCGTNIDPFRLIETSTARIPQVSHFLKDSYFSYGFVTIGEYERLCAPSSNELFQALANLDASADLSSQFSEPDLKELKKMRLPLMAITLHKALSDFSNPDAVSATIDETDKLIAELSKLTDKNAIHEQIDDEHDQNIDAIEEHIGILGGVRLFIWPFLLIASLGLGFAKSGKPLSKN